MPSALPVFSFEMPQWLEDFLARREKVYPSMEGRMRLVLELARLNAENGTGGPFAAAIFTIEDHRLVAPGINLVESANCSILHAEITAIALAQKITGSYDLGGPGMPALELVCSSEPCTMCMGAVCWSGVRRLVCGARDEDVRNIGFDEGPKPASWADELRARGIEVLSDVERMEAVSGLLWYKGKGGLIYNSRKGSSKDRNL